MLYGKSQFNQDISVKMSCSNKHKICLLTIFFCCGSTGLAIETSDGIRKKIEADWRRQEQVSRKLKSDSPEALAAAINRGRLMIADMRKLGPDDAANKAENVLLKVESLQNEIPRSGVTYEQLYFKVRWALHELALSNRAIK